MRRFLVGILALMSLCFAELRVDNQEKKFDIGFFVGGGIGVGANAMTYGLVPKPSGGYYDENQSFASFVASVKVGAYHYFTPMIGMRVYYNLDLNVLPLDEYTDQGESYTPYVLSTSHTLNADAIINVFSRNNMDIAVIGGIGLGALTGEVQAKNETLFYPIGSSNRFLSFEFRLNLGTRVMFDKKYGVEFMAKLPVTPSTMITQNGVSNIKYSPYYFTLDFVMERF